jgi:membrane protein DedA with SNARE-associated domain
MSRLVEALLGLRGVFAYGLVGLLAFADTAVFVGVFVPGELAVLLGGVLASEGRVSLPVMLAVAILAAVAGDSAGYAVGRRLGPRLIASQLVERWLGDQIRRATAYLRRRGSLAVVLGRWTSVLRAVVPGAAGLARMPYGHFLVANLAGGVPWATAFVLLGYGAGRSYQRAERTAGEASTLLLAAILVLAGLRWWGHRRASRRSRPN